MLRVALRRPVVLAPESSLALLCASLTLAVTRQGEAEEVVLRAGGSTGVSAAAVTEALRAAAGGRATAPAAGSHGAT
jgi:hypothetical protein